MKKGNFSPSVTKKNATYKVEVNAPEEMWLNMNPKGALSNGLDNETHL